VPANQIIGLPPGDVFVHRNVGNLLPGEDLNSHSVIQYAVDALQIRHIIVCGHYDCGGVLAALRGDRVGLVDYWLSGCAHCATATGPRWRNCPTSALATPGCVN
jgi:carbonic anhydrase